MLMCRLCTAASQCGSNGKQKQLVELTDMSPARRNGIAGVYAPSAGSPNGTECNSPKQPPSRVLHFHYVNTTTYKQPLAAAPSGLCQLRISSEHLTM
jgi:hypothetical protein